MALHDFPLTRARFLVAGARKSSNNENPFRDVDATVIDYWCEWASDVVQSALGDRVTPPLLQWDAALEGTAIALAHYQIIVFVRGTNKLTGADAAIVQRNKMAEEYLARLRPGTSAPGKSENPRFTDSGSNKPRDSIKIVSERNSMSALLRPCRTRCC